MAQSIVNILFKGDDAGVTKTAKKTGDALKKLGTQSGSVSQKMKAGWQLTATGISSIINIISQVKQGFDSLVNRYKAQVESEAKLASALKATGNAVGISFTGMKKMASQMSNLTAIGD